MTKSNKNLFIGAFVVIGAGAYLVYRFATKAKPIAITETDTNTTKDDKKTTKSTVASIVLPVASYPLKVGSKGSNVVTLQKWLNDKGYASPKLVTDGVFGAKTESAVKAMQDTPYEKSISDYINKAQWGSNYSFGQVSQEFYDVFITKTKKLDSSYSVGNISSYSGGSSSSSSSSSSTNPFEYVSPFGGGFKFN